ncbi:MAG TPA: GcrA family cell cycle regulator [Beijerinckiaceae bacterium]|jgi:GcrA cell cycle regulator|nr:GcrA family cell cycle regulator [Beijerinckiaceae bacterium]
MSWTDERVEMLRKLWHEGLSASKIAAQIANGITRNAVIGKVHRLGLSGRVKAPTPSQPRQRNRPPQSSHRVSMLRSSGPAVRGNNALAYAPRIYVAPEPLVEEVVVPICERVTITELKEAMCRWPLGDPANPEFRYCGVKSPPGQTYCPYHSRLAYQPAQDRRRIRPPRTM